MRTYLRGALVRSPGASPVPRSLRGRPRRRAPRCDGRVQPALAVHGCDGGAAVDDHHDDHGGGSAGVDGVGVHPCADRVEVVRRAREVRAARRPPRLRRSHRTHDLVVARRAAGPQARSAHRRAAREPRRPWRVRTRLRDEHRVAVAGVGPLRHRRLRPPRRRQEHAAHVRHRHRGDVPPPRSDTRNARRADGARRGREGHRGRLRAARWTGARARRHRRRRARHGHDPRRDGRAAAQLLRRVVRHRARPALPRAVPAQRARRRARRRRRSDAVVHRVPAAADHRLRDADRVGVRRVRIGIAVPARWRPCRLRPARRAGGERARPHPPGRVARPRGARRRRPPPHVLAVRVAAVLPGTDAGARGGRHHPLQPLPGLRRVRQLRRVRRRRVHGLAAPGRQRRVPGVRR